MAIVQQSTGRPYLDALIQKLRAYEAATGQAATPGLLSQYSQSSYQGPARPAFRAASSSSSSAPSSGLGSSSQPQPQPQQQQQQQGPSVSSAAGSVAGTGTGIYAGNKGYDYLASKFGGQAGAPAGAQGASGGGQSLTSAGAAAAGAPEGSIIVPAGEAVPEGYIGVQSMADGSTMATPIEAGMISPLTGSLSVAAYYGPSLYKLIQDFRKEGLNKSTGIRGALIAGGPPTMWAVPIIDKLGLTFGAGKHEDQVGRDAVRKVLQEGNFVDKDWNLTTVKGNKVNIGLDGNAKADYAGGGAPYNVNPTHNYGHQAASWALPLATAITGGDEKLTSDFAGYLANAALSDASNMEDVRGNVLKFITDAGFVTDEASSGRDKLVEVLTSLKDGGRLEEERYNVLVSFVDRLLAGDANSYEYGTQKQWEDYLSGIGSKPQTGGEAPLVPLPAAIPPGTAPAPGSTIGTPGYSETRNPEAQTIAKQIYSRSIR